MASVGNAKKPQISGTVSTLGEVSGLGAVALLSVFRLSKLPVGRASGGLQRLV
jgi:hypothetical protein